MADYTYFIFDAASNTAPNFTTWAGARNDFAANNRMGAGTGVVDSGVLTFKKTGHSTTCGTFNLVAAAGISIGSGGSIVIDGDTGKFNASASNALAYSNTFDGMTPTSDEGIATDLDKVTIRNLVIKGSLTGGSVISITQGTAGMTTTIENCVLVQGANSANSVVAAQANTILRNCLIKQESTSATAVCVDLNLRHATNPTIEQCVLIGNASNNGCVRDVATSGSSLTNVKNSYAGVATTPWGGMSAGSSAGNASSSTDAPGTGAINSVAHSTANFTSVTGNGDYRVVSSSALKTTGATRLASTLTDAYGQSRSATTTIGAHAAEFTAGGSGVTFFNNPPMRQGSMGANFQG